MNNIIHCLVRHSSVEIDVLLTQIRTEWRIGHCTFNVSENNEISINKTRHERNVRMLLLFDARQKTNRALAPSRDGFALIESRLLLDPALDVLPAKNIFLLNISFAFFFFFFVNFQPFLTLCGLLWTDVLFFKLRIVLYVFSSSLLSSVVWRRRPLIGKRIAPRRLRALSIVFVRISPVSPDR